MATGTGAIAIRAARAGAEVVGTQGTPVELLGNLIKKNLYPELWRVRNELTTRSNEEG